MSCLLVSVYSLVINEIYIDALLDFPILVVRGKYHIIAAAMRLVQDVFQAALALKHMSDMSTTSALYRSHT